ncbi:hypothetical protein EV127DRAFT_25370 [Xylaria flabelliformis]|nr:hypothetical protein EV127DRAFT_25370 [Xylaria flabelliformis]
MYFYSHVNLFSFKGVSLFSLTQKCTTSKPGTVPTGCFRHWDRQVYMRPQQLSTDPVPWRPSHTQSCLFQPFPPLSFHAFSRPTSARGRTHQHGRLRLFLPGLVKDLAIWGRLLIVALSLTSGAPFFSFCFALSVSSQLVASDFPSHRDLFPVVSFSYSLLDVLF